MNNFSSIIQQGTDRQMDRHMNGRTLIVSVCSGLESARYVDEILLHESVRVWLMNDDNGMSSVSSSSSSSAEEFELLVDGVVLRCSLTAVLHCPAPTDDYRHTYKHSTAEHQSQRDHVYQSTSHA